MISPRFFYDTLNENGIDFFTGVPDSLLKDICAYITDHTDDRHNIIAANEGCAVGLAAGYHLSTGRTGLVYMQNSGLGNAVNPLLSLADEEVYSIPLLLMIGWRGEPGIKDEPQHVKQGLVTPGLLNTMGIPFQILPEDEAALPAVMEKAVSYMKSRKAPYAILVRKSTFESYKLQTAVQSSFDMIREEALDLVLSQLGEKDIVVSTTGKTSREVFEIREKLSQGHEKDFLTVGSMGHASQIALGMAVSGDPGRNVFCLDGDGAFLMQMGGLSSVSGLKPENFRHIVLNNGVHDSVGGQPTTAMNLDLPVIAKSCGYTFMETVDSAEGLKDSMARMRRHQGPAFLEIKVNKGARKDLGRPTIPPAENKIHFMKNAGALK